MKKKIGIKSIQDSFLDPAVNRDFRKELTYSVRRFILAPLSWDGFPEKNFTNFKWNPISFKSASKAKLKPVEGLYMFVIKPDICNAKFLNYLMYIGETDNLQRRFGEYLAKEGDPKSPQYQMYTLIDDYPNNLEFYFAELPGMNEATRKDREAELLTAFFPPVNGKYPAFVQKLLLQTFQK